MSMKARIISRKIFVMNIYEQIVAMTSLEEVNTYNFLLYNDVSLALEHMVYMAERFFTN